MKLKPASILFLSLLLMSSSLMAQAQQTVKGRILDNKKQPLIGATVVLKFLKNKGTITDLDGNFTLNLPSEGLSPEKQVIVISSVGFKAQEINFSKNSNITVELEENNTMVNEVVVVGYGTQKKESLIGAITQTKGDLLEKSGGVSSLGATLTGKLPGVITVASSGAPGGEDPKIYIRGTSSWNNSDPLVLVDGIERSMNSVDIGSVESISVLKDASATAVFGVKGANGVILITTKRGKEGKADIRVSLNTTIKVPSKLVSKYDSYDALSIRNTSIESELGLYPGGWGKNMPTAMLAKYRNPANQAEADQYPNVNWQDALVKKSTTSQNASINISGGTSNVRYFTAVDYLKEGDLLNVYDNGKSYTPGYGYNRFNVRSNLDVNLTKTTVLSANLAGSYGVKQDSYNQDNWEYRIWQSIYSNPPDVYQPHYADGSWGYYPDNPVATINSAQTLANNGVRRTTTEQITTDFTLKQDLNMILSGLTAKATLSYDNTFMNVGGILDDGTGQQQYVNPKTGEVTYSQFMQGSNKFDWIPSRWSPQSDAEYKNIWGGDNTYRKLFYLFQVDYAKKIGKHDFTVMGMFSRDQNATGSEFAHYREDWVSRATYNYAGRYLAEVNGAYNGTEKFGPKNRFAFFPSLALGWTLSEESFMKGIKFLDLLKLRGSWGQVGNDYTDPATRWAYMTQWGYGNNASLGTVNGTSPYTQYKINSEGNEDLHWEQVTKKNVGLDYAFLNGLVSGTFEVFNDYRTDILLKGSDRAVPSYYGATPATANFGKVTNNGYEVSIKLNKQLNKELRLWADFNMSHAQNKIIEADDPQMKDDYLKKAGKSIGQNYSYVTKGYANNWDQIYGTTQWNTNNTQKLPGTLNMIDYNGDGVIDDKDKVPYGYNEVPQNTYSATLGFDWKNLSVFVQFYGVNNASRYLELQSFGQNLDNVYKQGSYWSKTNTGADAPQPRWNAMTNYSGSSLYLFDGSYIRLKNVEIAYTFKEPWVKKVGMNSFRAFVNGDNLMLWSKLPDDREVNNNNATAYPTVRRINIGLNVNF